MVDTAAQDVERGVDRSVGLLLQNLLDLAVRTVRRDILTIRTYEKRRQRSTAGNLAISLGELTDVVVGTLFKRLVGTGDSLLKHRIVRTVSRQGLQHIFHLHFEHDIHTSLQVKTQVDLLLLDLLVGERNESEVIDRLVLHGVQIIDLRRLTKRVRLRNFRGILGRLFLHAPRFQ